MSLSGKAAHLCASEAPTVGAHFGRWRLDGVLGRGGMGVVFRASSGAEVVALKVIHPHLLGDPHTLRRFQREAEAGARVRHRNVVRTLGVEAVETPQGLHHAMVMELVHGRTLAEFQAGLGTLPEGLLRDIVRQVSCGLTAIHEAGLIHRDLKPENVLVTDMHEVKVMDLGLVRLRDEDIRLSRTGQFIGSLLYAAPEQLGDNQSEVTPAADLYALGLMIFQLAAGSGPFEAQTVASIVRAHLTEIPPPLRARAPGVSPFLEGVVAALLAKSPADRLRSAREVEETLAIGEASAWWRAHRPARAATAHVAAGGGLPLLERADELRTLVQAWESARGGHSSTVVLASEPGLGRTRLLQAFVEACDLAGRPELLGVGTGLPSALPSLSAAVAAALPAGDIRGVLSELVPGPEGRRRALAGALEAVPADVGPALAEACGTGPMVDLLLELARRSPRVLVVDDPELLSAAERTVLRSVLSAASRGGLLRVVSVALPLAPELQSVLPDREAATWIELAPLSDATLREHLRSQLGEGRALETLASSVVPRAGGSPHLLERLVDGLRACGALRRTSSGAWAVAESTLVGELPLDVHRWVEDRLGILDPEDRKLVDAAAVQGRKFDVRVLAATLGQPQLAVLERLTPLSRAPRLVRGEGRLRTLEPAPLQEIAYERLGTEERTRLHQAAGRAWHSLVACGVESRLTGLPEHVRHRLRGGEGGAVEAVLLEALDLLVEARRSIDALALSEEAAIQCNAFGPRVRSRFFTRRARLLELRGRRAEEHLCLEAALSAYGELDDDPPPSLLLALGRCLVALGRIDEVHTRFGSRAASAAERGDAAEAAAAEAVVAHAALSVGASPLARRAAERALFAARSAGHAPLTCEALGLVALVLEREGRPRPAADHQERRLELAGRAGDVHQALEARGALARIEAQRGRWAEARAHAAQQAVLAEQTGCLAGEAEARWTLGRVVASTDAPAAGRHLDEACRLARSAGQRTLEADASIDMARLRIRRGDPAGAMPALLGVLGRPNTRDTVDGRTATARLGAAEAALARRDWSDANTWCDAALAAAPTGDSRLLAEIHLLRARVILGCARGTAARPVLALAREAAERASWPAGLALVAGLVARCGGEPRWAVRAWVRHGHGLSAQQRGELHGLLSKITHDAWHGLQADRISHRRAVCKAVEETSGSTAGAVGGAA